MQSNLTRRLRTYRITGIILHRRDQGEADRLVTLLTPDRGKITLLAKGARKITSRKGGHLELFTHVRLQVAKARTWDIITQAEAVEVFPHLRANLRRMAHAYYMAELVLRLSPEEQGDVPLFDLALETLGYLDREPNLLLVSRWFEAHLLRITGFQPQLYLCAACGETLDVSLTNYWAPVLGGAVCPQCGKGRKDVRPLSPGVLKLMRYFQTHAYQDVRNLPVRPEVLRELETYIQAYLRVVVEGELRSLAFIHRLRQELAR